MNELTHCTDENKARVTLMEDVLVQVWYPIVPDWNVRKEWECPRVSRTNDESVDICYRGTIDEVDGLIDYVRDRWLLHDLWMLESVVAEI